MFIILFMLTTLFFYLVVDSYFLLSASLIVSSVSSSFLAHESMCNEAQTCTNLTCLVLDTVIHVQA